MNLLNKEKISIWKIKENNVIHVEINGDKTRETKDGMQKTR